MQASYEIISINANFNLNPLNITKITFTNTYVTYINANEVVICVTRMLDNQGKKYIQPQARKRIIVQVSSAIKRKTFCIN